MIRSLRWVIPRIIRYRAKLLEVLLVIFVIIELIWLLRMSLIGRSFFNEAIVIYDCLIVLL
jgi:hypothetical protein